jgi:L-lactate dehydrogenase
MEEKNMSSKIVIIGAGNVGTSIAYAAMIRGSVRNISIIDLDPKKTEGEVADLNHGLAYVQPIQITRGTYRDCATADVVVITAGARQVPNESRLELIGKNVVILKSIINQIKEVLIPNHKSPILLIVSNPVDILTYFASKFSGFPSSRVIGSGTVLDSARLRFEIARHCEVDDQNVHGYVLGEHGDTEFVAWSMVRIGGMTLQSYCPYCKHPCNGQIYETIATEVRTSAYKIIESKGYTNYGVGIAVARLLEAILRDQNTILPVSSVLSGQNHLDGVALSLPCVINSAGIREIFELQLNETETAQLNRSAKELKKIIVDVEQQIT